MTINHSTFDTILTRSGLRLRVRPIRPDDAPYLLQIFEQMSSASRYLRFNQPVDKLTEERKLEEAERIAQAFPQRSGGFIAFADLPEKGNVAVAAIRYVCTGNAEAETAVSVIDALQRQGVGMQLMLMLVKLAQQEGIKRLTAEIRNDNEGIWKILHRLPYYLERQREGAFSHVCVDLTRLRAVDKEGDPTQTAVS